MQLFGRGEPDVPKLLHPHAEMVLHHSIQDQVGMKMKFPMLYIYTGCGGLYQAASGVDIREKQRGVDISVARKTSQSFSIGRR